MRTNYFERQKFLLQRCAMANTLWGIPCFIVLSFLLTFCHERNIGGERLISAVIGGIIGWCLALWGSVFLLWATSPVGESEADSVHDASPAVEATGVSDPKSEV